MDQEKIKEIYTKSREEKWDYKKVFEAYRDAGVKHYSVDVKTYLVTFSNDEFSFNIDPPADFKELEVANLFDMKNILWAKAEQSNGSMSFVEYLEVLAGCGVSEYEVMIDKRTLTYKGDIDELIVKV